ncbi:response regulator [Mucilaginibacter ginsenosidivorax]|uniref:Response regulator n=1 Tax=Mucilaginibacter ginsenosidivorax TaxID=862126 RepID=A0A5B8W1W8_9SPHI|nr:response regulator [Mucilaginibacter ginsenosidivorax]QEC76955.1 response regulator [Mucilaginibacter ginsenosidivorax]
MMNVFLIDDDATFIFLTKRVIKNTGIEAGIFEFANGRHAIDHLLNNHDDKALMPDIIFLDLSMPVMDGWEFLEEYEALPPGIEKAPLYILSSSISPHDINLARLHPAVSDFLIKPITKEKILQLCKG